MVIVPFVGTEKDVLPYSLYLLDVIYDMNEDRVTTGNAIKEHNKK